jgi:hypothetical protein
MKFSVSTLHGSKHDGEFIVPRYHVASSHFEAAKLRFNVLAPDEQKRVTALLVQKYDTFDGWVGQPRIFFVEDAEELVKVKTRQVVKPA